ILTNEGAVPFVFVTGEEEGPEDYQGITMYLSEMLGFTYSVSVLPDDVPTTTGVELVGNGTYDMAASWITINEERSEFASFTYPYFDVGVRFVYRKALDPRVDLWKAYTPFQGTLWLAILLCLVTTVILLWLFEGAKNDQFSVGSWDMRRRAYGVGLSRSVYVIAALMLGQLTHKPETLEGYMLTIGWLFASFILAASYTAELASFLTVNK
ncbi:unnamed protein product, partial [Discosporangium mesarthrocarpum]